MPRKEMPAWSWPGFLFRRLLATALDTGDHGCAARRCGLLAPKKARYCAVHQDVLVARYGSGGARETAVFRLGTYGRLTRRRLERWADSVAESSGDVFNLVSENFDAFHGRTDGGIVSEAASL